METVSNFATWAWTILGPIYALVGPPGILYLAYMVVSEFQRRGYQTTYASAILRAVGAGMDAAKAQGLDPFGAGRVVAEKAGAEYLKTQVGIAAAKLKITDADHELKVGAELSLLEHDLRAGATATGVGSAVLAGVAAVEGKTL